MRKQLLAIVVALAACKSHSDSTAPDNTAQNSHVVAPTADNAGNSKSDVETTQAIRKAVVADSSLSTNAQNCKIVVQHGAVTLQGPVASNDERLRIESIAVRFAGSGNVTDQLQVTN